MGLGQGGEDQLEDHHGVVQAGQQQDVDEQHGLGVHGPDEFFGRLLNFALQKAVTFFIRVAEM